MNQINGMDDIFLHFEHSGLPMHVGSVALYHPPSAWRGRSNFTQIRESIRRGVARAPVLRQRLVSTPLHLDRPHWTGTASFQLDEHIRRVSLPRPGSWEQLRSLVTRVFEEPLDLARPLFQVTVIEDLGGIADLPPGSFALVTKVHHAALDGVSAVEVMRTFCDASTDDVEEAPDLDGRQSEPRVASLLGRAWLNQLERGLGAARLAATSLRTLARPRGTSSQSNSVTTEAKPVPSIRFNGCPSSSRAFGGCHFSLSQVQAVRHAVPGATVNDVVLTVVGGALRRVLEEHGELPSDPVVAMAPISIRSKEEGADSGEATGNRVSMMAVGLGTDIADPLERLEVVHQTARSSKQSSRASGSNTLLDIANLVPSALGELVVRAYRGLGLSSLHPAFFSCVVTNVPGPREALFLAGGRMVACYGMGPIFDGVGLIHPVLSYDGGITISFTSCPEMLPNPARYEECIHEAFEELAQAAGVQGTTDLAAAGRPGR
jgi:WS/DGAT/MGAT family acyltransferase